MADKAKAPAKRSAMQEHRFLMRCAQKLINDRRDAGEDMDLAYIDQKTYEVKFRAPLVNRSEVDPSFRYTIETLHRGHWINTMSGDDWQAINEQASFYRYEQRLIVRIVDNTK